ncbi:MAG: glucans biosynthesis glucosyltransferase MdoH, partial [Hyphomicrobium sp.]
MSEGGMNEMTHGSTAAATAGASGVADVAPPPSSAVRKDASDPAHLPVESPLDMPEQDFNAGVVQQPRPAPRRGYWVARAAVMSGAMLLTAAFAHELYSVLAFVRMTPIQFIFLVLSTIAFGWISLGSLSAAMGFLPLYTNDSADTITMPPASGPLAARTALLFPVYHEDPARIAGTIEAMAEDLASHGRATAFDVFVLSDTRGTDQGSAEQRVYAALARHVGTVINVYYRRRRDNVGRKAGNIKDWVERFGGGYAHFVILDADSVMSAETLLRLA